MVGLCWSMDIHSLARKGAPITNGLLVRHLQKEDADSIDRTIKEEVKGCSVQYCYIEQVSINLFFILIKNISFIITLRYQRHKALGYLN